MNDNSDIDLKVGQRFLLSDEVRNAHYIGRLLWRTNEECLIIGIRDNQVDYKLCWDSGYGSCTLEQAISMRRAWLKRDFPALAKDNSYLNDDAS